VQPLVLRARAGDCIQINLTNQFTAAAFSGVTADTYGVTMTTSTTAGLHPQLVAYDVTASDGMNAGFNPTQTVAASSGATKTYYWYAGNLTFDNNGKVTDATPVELGPLVLRPADPLLQGPLGLGGALIVEPRDATWDSATATTASIFSSSATFRELVAVGMDDLSTAAFTSVATGGSGSPQGIGHAVNYGNESMVYRYNNANPGGNLYIGNATSNTLVGNKPVQTPGFNADPKVPTRIRFVHAGGSGTQHAMTLHGHVWQEEPFTNNSTKIGLNPGSQWLGSRDSHGPNDHFDIVLPFAGGVNGVLGSYLYRTFFPGEFQDGFWGYLQVGAAPLTTPEEVEPRALVAEQPTAGAPRPNPAKKDRKNFVPRPLKIKVTPPPPAP
jgi:hypothetical protein